MVITHRLWPWRRVRTRENRDRTDRNTIQINARAAPIHPFTVNKTPRCFSTSLLREQLCVTCYRYFMFIVVVSLVSLHHLSDDFLNLLCPWPTIRHVSLKVNDADKAVKFSEKAVVLALNLYQSDWSFTNIFLCRFLFLFFLRWHACLRSLTRTVEILGEDSPLGIHVVPYCSSLSGRWVCMHTNNCA